MIIQHLEKEKVVEWQGHENGYWKIYTTVEKVTLSKSLIFEFVTLSKQKHTNILYKYIII